MALRELHLFAGIGGGILGGMLLGHRCVGAVEIDPYCRRVLEARQRDGILEPFPIHDDIRTFDATAWRGRVDVVCGVCDRATTVAVPFNERFNERVMMHWYPFNIGDFYSHTKHLTPIEDIAYRRMLDEYYLHERPLVGEPAAIARLVRMLEHVEDVASVLREFFTLDERDGSWRHDRAEEELKRARAKAEQASDAGRASARLRNNRRATPVELWPRGSTAVVEPTSNGTHDSVQPPVHSTQYTVPTPTPPFGNGDGGCASAEPERGPAQQGGAVVDQVAAIARALEPTTIRSNERNGLKRFVLLRKIAESALRSGFLAEHVAPLWKLAQAQTNDDPGGLLNTWIYDNTWREVLDEAAGKVKESKIAAARRAAQARDPDAAPPPQSVRDVLGDLPDTDPPIEGTTTEEAPQ